MPNNPPSMTGLPGIIHDLQQQVATLAARVPRPEAQQSLYEIARRSGARCKVRRSTAQSIPDNALTAISWDVEVSDAHGMWEAANPTRLVAPWDGTYAASTTVGWSSVNGVNSYRQCGLYLNGSTVTYEEFDQVGVFSGLTVLGNHWSSDGFYLAAGEYAEVKVKQNSGAARTIAGDGFGIEATFAKLVYLGPGPVAA